MSRVPFFARLLIVPKQKDHVVRRGELRFRSEPTVRFVKLRVVLPIRLVQHFWIEVAFRLHVKVRNDRIRYLIPGLLDAVPLLAPFLRDLF